MAPKRILVIKSKPDAKKAKTLFQDEIGSLLYEASRLGDLETVKKLLKLGAEVDMKNEKNETALHAAVESGHLEVVLTL